MGRFGAVARTVTHLWPPRTRGGVVRAAGGILLRRGVDGRTEVAIIHRPDRDDWSLPKGKLDPGERYEEGALREVFEETGYRCRLVEYAGFTQYRDRRGRPKVVRYWVMEVLGGAFTASTEVDEVRWLALDHAAAMLTYQRDRDLLGALDEADLARSG